LCQSLLPQHCVTACSLNIVYKSAPLTLCQSLLPQHCVKLCSLNIVSNSAPSTLCASVLLNIVSKVCSLNIVSNSPPSTLCASLLPQHCAQVCTMHKRSARDTCVVGGGTGHSLRKRTMHLHNWGHVFWLMSDSCQIHYPFWAPASLSMLASPT
jgi:hypothetical protein